MANNIEIKARVRDIDAVARRAESLAGAPGRLVEQHDTFFAVATGRLKLRRFADGSAELIAYLRPDASGPTASDYEIVPVPDPDRLWRALAKVPGVRGDVVKRRRLFLVGRARVHLDEVERLGHFVELEVVLHEDEAPKEGMAEAEALMRALGIAPDELIECAYIDLLEAGA